jgi:hypothetical protein
MRRLSHATPVSTDRLLKTDEHCICGNLLAKLVEYKRARYLHPEPGLDLDVTLSEFLDTETKCPACSSMRRRLRSIGLPALAQNEYTGKYLQENIKVNLRIGMMNSNADARWHFGQIMPVQGNLIPVPSAQGQT